MPVWMRRRTRAYVHAPSGLLLRSAPANMDQASRMESQSIQSSDSLAVWLQFLWGLLPACHRSPPAGSSNQERRGNAEYCNSFSNPFTAIEERDQPFLNCSRKD